jgi:hypothetical protein
MATNRDRLIEANILKEDVDLNEEQQQAIEELTEHEIDTLISVKDKVADKFPPESLISPIMHHH